MPLLAQEAYPLETQIARYLAGSGLSSANQLRLSAWLELKGDYDPALGAYSARFGDLATLVLYPGNWLLRTAGHRIYHLDRRRPHPREARYMDEALSALFEQIPLLAHQGADTALIAFVDAGLARKPIEPFAKLYLRHVLIHYGDFDGQQVIFHSQRLPTRHSTPVRLRLDRHSLRGYYLQSGGTAYVTDVARPVAYASGEATAPHIAAFKLMAHSLFQETMTHVASQRTSAKPSPSRAALLGRSRGQATPPPPTTPYPPDRWIGVLLAQLRSRNLSIADPDILPYFLDAPYFPEIYARLSPQERAEVDGYRR